MVGIAYNPSIQEAEAWIIRIYGQHEVDMEFQTNPGYKRHFKKNEKEEKNKKEGT